MIGSTRLILNEDHNVERVSALAQELARNQAFRSFYYEDGKLLFVGAIYLNTSYDYVTYVCMELNTSRMFFNFTSTALKSFQSVLVVDDAQIFCLAGEDHGINPQELEKTLSVEHNGTSYAVFTCRNSSYANWKIYALMDESAYYQAVKQQTSMVAIVLIMTIFATLVTSLLFAKRITHPLEQLTRSFQRLEQGEYPPPLAVASDDEVGQLIHSYNHVVKSLEKLNENIIAEQEEKRRFEIAAVKTRLDLLQSQIWPLMQETQI